MTDYSFIENTMLFKDSSEEEIRDMLLCLGAEQKCFEKNEVIYFAGDLVQDFGLVLTGSVYIESDDFWGNHTILNHIGAGFVFAETYACVPATPLMVTVRAAEKCNILFLNATRILKTCPNTCSHHSRLIQNLLMITAQKNLQLSRKISHTSPKSIRGRVLSYLSFQATLHDSYDFDIPFNRQQLADYLSVDRSALSNELSKMQNDGLFVFHKNHFHLIAKLPDS